MLDNERYAHVQLFPTSTMCFASWYSFEEMIQCKRFSYLTTLACMGKVEEMISEEIFQEHDAVGT